MFASTMALKSLENGNRCCRESRRFMLSTGRGFTKMMLKAPPVGLEPTTNWLTASRST